VGSAGLFGTDGVRGRANDELTPELAMGLAAAVVRASSVARPTVVVGADSRPSASMLAAAVQAGIATAGGDAIWLGLAPTAMVAHVLATGGADIGIVITASHNPASDNGIKVFGRGGRKLSDASEQRIEAMLDEPWTRPTGSDVGTVRPCDGSQQEAYVDALLDTVSVSLEGLRVVVDCANGAASQIAPEVYETAGAEVIAIHAGDGMINERCGATHLEPLQQAVTAHGADLGIAHDGDADRCLLVDSTGQVVDGDQILAILAQGQPAVVTTVMANLAFVHAMRDGGIRVVTTPVGDRHVLEAMHREGIAVGGEQSGHIVLLEHAGTGDGILTALQVMAHMMTRGQSLAELASVVVPLPQVLVNIAAPRERAVDPDVLAAVELAEQRLGDSGRVLVRASGTEALVRVMVEAPTRHAAEAAAESIAALLR
jgi:phosphoglucosamine mutase